MHRKFAFATGAILVGSLAASTVFASDSASTGKKHPIARKAKAAKTPSVTEQIEQLRQELANQAHRIDSLTTDLSAKDQQLKQAEQTAADAQSAVAKYRDREQAEQQAVGDNAAAVSALQASVSGLKTAQSSLAETVSIETAKIHKAVDNPTTLHFKGVTLTPTGFFNGESVYRTHATGAGLATPFSALPYEHADAYSLSEATLTGAQSRIGLLAEGKVSWGVVRAYLEADFLGAGTTSNANQSNSYVLRQRLMMAEAETNSRWAFSAGQGWSLAAETKKGISTAAASIALPLQIDPNYVTGLVWARAGNLRVTKNFNKAAFAVAVENPQLLYSASLAGSTPYAVLGSAGTNGGLMNNSVSACSPTTSVVNYTNQVDGGTDVAVPVYKTVNACTNLANITFNQAPDLLAKAAFDPGIGHYEIFGIARFGHETVYPGETTNSNLYGGLKDIVTGATVAPALSTAGAISDSIALGGIGASARVPVIPNVLSLGAKGLYGAGMGHYGDSTLPDVTANAWGGVSPLHNLSGMLTAEYTPVQRLVLYAYYGGDYAGRADYGSAATTTLGAPTAEFCVTGTGVCTTTPTAAQMTAGGAWGAHWGAPAAAAVGYGSRLLSNSACLTNTNPGYNGSSTGFYPGASCSAQTRDTQEATGGYWYDIYKGDRGRLRQGIQYGYAVREAWSGATGVGAKGVENMVFTSFRYYLP